MLVDVDWWWAMSHFFSQFCDDSDPIDLSWPDRWKDRIIYIIKAPLLFPMYYTALDCRRPVSFSYYSLKKSSFVYFASKVRYLQMVKRVMFMVNPSCMGVFIIILFCLFVVAVHYMWIVSLSYHRRRDICIPGPSYSPFAGLVDFHISWSGGPRRLALHLESIRRCETVLVNFVSHV